LTQQKINLSLKLHKFSITQPRHRGKKCDSKIMEKIGNRHTIRVFIVRKPNGAAIKRFLIIIVELKTTLPGFPFGYAFHNDIDINMLGILFSINLSNISFMEIEPKKIRGGDRDGGQIPSVDGHADSFFLFSY